MNAKLDDDARTEPDDDRLYPLEWAYGSPDKDLLEPSPSTGWRGTYAIMHAADQIRAASRRDRSERYRRKHQRGVTS